MTKRKIPTGMDGPVAYDYEGLKVLSNALRRPVATLIALSPTNDPFYVTPTRRASAIWFAGLWKKFNIGHGIHLRRLHYLFVSQGPPLKMPGGTPYENSEACSEQMGKSRQRCSLSGACAHQRIC